MGWNRKKRMSRRLRRRMRMWRGGQDERTQFSFYKWYSHLVLELLALLASPSFFSF